MRLQTDRQTDGRGDSSIPPPNFVGGGGYNNMKLERHHMRGIIIIYCNYLFFLIQLIFLRIPLFIYIFSLYYIGVLFFIYLQLLFDSFVVI